MNDTLANLLDKAAERSGEGVTQPRLLSLQAERRISTTLGLPRLEVQTTAVAMHILPKRYLRNLGTVGWEGQEQLLESTVAIVGSGGLGGWIIEGLARMGVGHLVLVDGDAFEESNLNRQALCTEDSLGQTKVEEAVRRIGVVNGAVQVRVHQTWVNAENLPNLLAGVTVVVDALDVLPTRLILQDASQNLGIPLVHGAIAGYTGQVMTVLPGDSGLYALYGRGPVPERGIETQVGNPSATPMMVAAWQIQETVKLITGQGSPLRNRLLLIDAESGSCDFLRLGRA